MKVGILGAGTWGIALARMFCNIGHSVTVWSAIEKEIIEYQATHTHPKIKGMVIPQEICFTVDLQMACQEKDIIMFAVPSAFVRGTAAKASSYIPNGQIIIDVAKGIEANTLKTMTEVIADELSKVGVGAKLVALSGPTHAEEVAFDLPTTIVAACEDLQVAELVQDAFMNTCMRVYTNTDVKGVELCGALKNIVALAAGISKGLGYGDNTKAALITRGMAEITRLGRAMGCAEHTFYGLAGIGDLIVTATSEHSRNNKAGQLIGQGVEVSQAIEQVGMVVEGISALPAALRLAKVYNVEMPIIEGVNATINGSVSPRDVVNNLMTRDKKKE